MKADAKRRTDAALIADVRAYYAAHPQASRRGVAGALRVKYGRSGDRGKAIEALAKRIKRLPP